MPSRQEIVDGTSRETQLFLARRLRKLRTEISGFLNVNPFLMCAIKDFHNITNQYTFAEFMLVWHMGTGHATSFGKMVDECLLPSVFNTKRLDVTFRHASPYNLSAFDEIDHLVTIGNERYLLSLKASSYSIQYTMAMELYTKFHTIGSAGLYGHTGIVVGVFYGNETLLTDKYRILRGENRRRQDELEQLDYVKVKAGKEFWTWLNGGEEMTQDWVLEGIMEGTRIFSETNPEYSQVVGGAVSRLVNELRVKYKLPEDGSLDWYQLLHSINNTPGE